MKSLYTFISICLLSAATASAQLSVEDRALLRSIRFSQSESRKVNGISHSNHILALAKMADNQSADVATSTGASVTPLRGGFAVVSMPIDSVERTAALPCFKRFELSRNRFTHLNMARPASGVADLHAGTELVQPFTGKGVITGIVDQGVDPNHINFVDSDGASRLGYLANIYIANTSDGWYGREYDRDNIYRFQTDNTSTFHGTHTMGILAGGYDKNGLHGVATGADIAASCGDLADALIALGIERILDYRAWKNQPAVISLSIGSNTGSHSPNALMNAYLDEVAKEAMVVISAGNEGDIPLAIKGKFTEDMTTVRSFIRPTSVQTDLRYGEVRVYSEKKFTQQGLIYNSDRGSIRFRMPLADGQEKDYGLYYADQDYSGSDLVSTTFASAFTGYVGIGWSQDEATNEYYTILDYYTFDNPDTNGDGHLWLGFEVTGEPGQSFEIYCDGMFTDLTSNGVDGWTDGGCDGTINDMACGYQPLVVGSYNTRQNYKTFDGREVDYSTTFPVGKVTSFSSWGTLADGRSLPHVCAPGAVIMSSCSRYYDPGENATIEYYDQVTGTDGEMYPWIPAMGTSMATPYVAGALALWLEAYPELTMAQVKDIISRTSTVDDDVKAGNPVQWGAGKFNAAAGMAEVIRLNSVADVTTDVNDRLIVSREGSTITIMLPAAHGLSARVLNLAGATVLQKSTDGDTLQLDVTTLPSGIYVLSVNNRQAVKIAL